MRWRYRTILFEFHKDRVFGDKYIDDEEVEKTLNEQGAQGWELVNVTSIREGLLAFCKKPERPKESPAQTDQSSSLIESVKIAREPAIKAKEQPRYATLKSAQGPLRESDEDTTSRAKKDLIGEIKIR